MLLLLSRKGSKEWSTDAGIFERGGGKKKSLTNVFRNTFNDSIDYMKGCDVLCSLTRASQCIHSTRAPASKYVDAIK